MSPSSVPTLADLFATYAADYLPERAPGTQYEYQCLFARILRTLGPVPLVDLTPEVLRAWKLTLSTRNRPGTVRHHLKIVRAVLQIAVEDYGWLERNPMHRVRTPSAPPSVVRFLSDPERTALLAACAASPNPVLYPLVVLALSTGGRKNECRKLRWPEVDLVRGTVRFVATKNRETRTVPLLGEALRVLTDLAARRQPGVPWVFPRADGQAPCAIEWHWRHARTASGVQAFRFHDLRHTFASYLAMSGASLRDISELLGHKSIQETMRYAHALESHNTGVVERMIHRFLAPS